MNFREGTIEDLELMESLSIRKEDRKIDGVIDHLYTLEHNHEILGVGGFRMITKETAWCWVDFSEYGVKHLRDTYRVTRDWINGWAERMNVSRLQAHVRDNKKDKRLVDHLGFEQESIMKNFYGDEHALLYVRTF